MFFRAARLAAVAMAMAALCAPARAQDAGGLRLGTPEDLLAAGAQSDLPTPAPSPTPTGLKKKAATPGLPPLQAYPSAERLGLRGGPPAPDPTLVPAANVAAPPPLTQRKATPDDDPFAPLGIDLGDMRLTPYFEQDLGYSDNPGQHSQGGKGSGVSTTEVGAAFQSRWARDDLHGQLRAGYNDFFTDRAANAPYGSGDISGRLDVTRDLSFDAQGRFSASAETATSLGLSGVTIIGASAPLLTTEGATFGATDKFGRFSLALHGSIDRTGYQSATLSNGTIDDVASDNFSDTGVKLRGAYQASPEFSPFIEAATDARRYDHAIDANGYARNSTGWSASFGASVEVTRLITGEVSAGYAHRRYSDARLAPVRGPIVSASLIWSPTPLTTVTLNATSGINDSTIAGASSAMTRTVALDIAHRLLRNFLLGANAGYTTDKYNGVTQSDSTAIFGARAEYDIGRDIVLKATASRRLYKSSVPGSDYAADVFMLGLRVRR